MIDTYFKHILVKVEVNIKDKDDGLAKFGTGKYFTKFYANSVFGKSLSQSSRNWSQRFSRRTDVMRSVVYRSFYLLAQRSFKKACRDA